jgi:hypothetical protein
MPPRITGRRLGVGLAAAALLATALVGSAGAASSAEEAASTPVPVSTPDGLLMSYVVNAKAQNPGQTLLAERAVRAAGGTVVQSWPEIGVVIAHSTRAAFRSDVVRLAEGHAVESVGATRTVAVTEGTPGAGASTHGASPGESWHSRVSGQPTVDGLAAGDVTAAAPPLTRARASSGTCS